MKVSRMGFRVPSRDFVELVLIDSALALTAKTAYNS
jgi:hypothetical protein